jgi:hypothetical protein
MSRRDLVNYLAFQHFIGNFARCPMRDRPIGAFWFIASLSFYPTALICGYSGGRSRAWRIL